MRHYVIFVTICAVLLGGSVRSAEIDSPDSLSRTTDSVIADSAPTLFLADSSILIPKLDFSSVPLYEALTALVRTYNLSVAIDSSATGALTLHLVNVRLNDALYYIIKEYRLSW